MGCDLPGLLNHNSAAAGQERGGAGEGQTRWKPSVRPYGPHQGTRRPWKGAVGPLTEICRRRGQGRPGGALDLFLTGGRGHGRWIESERAGNCHRGRRVERGRTCGDQPPGPPKTNRGGAPRRPDSGVPTSAGGDRPVRRTRRQDTLSPTADRSDVAALPL